MSAAVGVLINGAAASGVDALDRGLQYGDGLFETIRVVHGRAPLWPWHRARLRRDCERLCLPAPDCALIEAEMAQVSAQTTRAVVRVTLTSGRGERGYARPRVPSPTRMVAALPAPGLERAAYERGVRVRWCETALGINPALAGIKHLNRLEQVLARAEWDDPQIAEGLQCDGEQRVVSATAANLFAVSGGRVRTPVLSRCGVAGVARQRIIELMPDCIIRDFTRAQLLESDEIFLSSSVRGIVPVRALAERAFAPGPVTRALQAQWWNLGYLDTRDFV